MKNTLIACLALLMSGCVFYNSGTQQYLAQAKPIDAEWYNQVTSDLERLNKELDLKILRLQMLAESTK